MKKHWPLILIILLSGCLSTRSTSKSKDNVKFFETSKIERKSPGDKIYIELPRTPKDRPKSTTETYIGDNGATSKKTFDESGYIIKDEIDCPEVNEIELRNREYEHERSLKETERKANIELANIISRTAIWIAAIFAVAWLAKGVIKPRGFP